jgi:hypothetical protein
MDLKAEKSKDYLLFTASNSMPVKPKKNRKNMRKFSILEATKSC